MRIVRPESVVAEMKELGIPQATVSFLVGFRSGSTLSNWLSGKADLSMDAQKEIQHAMHFSRTLADSVDVPIDFSNVRRLEPLWKQYCAQRDREEHKQAKTAVASA